jgi:hypothetical protein
MPTIWSVNPEPPLRQGKERRASDARVVSGSCPSLVCSWLPRDDYLQGNPSALERISGEPDGGIAAKAELVDDPVPATVHVAEMDRVEAAWLVVFEFFTFVEFAGMVFPRQVFGIHVHVECRASSSVQLSAWTSVHLLVLQETAGWMPALRARRSMHDWVLSLW